MNQSLDIFRIARQNVLKIIDGVSLDQLNKIPNGFTGNMAWRLGHLVSTQQGLLYRLSGNATNLDQTFIDKYKEGSVPLAPISQQDLDFIKSELAGQPERLKADMENGIFKSYTPYSTSFGNTMNNFEEALAFVGVHEGMHIGYLLALKRTVAAG